jgi:hypothetical protein
MPRKTGSKSPAFVLELRKTGIPKQGDMAARVYAKDEGYALRGEYYYWTGDEFGLRFTLASTSKDNYRELAAAVATLYDDLRRGRAVQYEGMPKKEPVAAYLNSVLDERVAKRRARLLAAEKKAYPHTPRPYAVHLECWGRDSWSLTAIPEGGRSPTANGSVDVRRKKPVLHSVYGNDSNEILAEAGVAAINQAWSENGIVLLEPEGYSPRTKQPAMKRVRLRDYCTKHQEAKKSARTGKVEEQAA